jgi:hypothetical protein
MSNKAINKIPTLADGYNVSAPGANTDILSADIAPLDNTGTTGSIFRITLVLATSSVVNVMVDDGSTQFAVPLNDNTAITAEAWYREAFAVRPGLTYNFQVETDGVIRILHVEEILDGVI